MWIEKMPNGIGAQKEATQEKICHGDLRGPNSGLRLLPVSTTIILIAEGPSASFRYHSFSGSLLSSQLEVCQLECSAFFRFSR